jgi:proline iminopeptidase
VTHYVRHDAFLDDDQLLRRAHVLERIRGTLVHGRLDVAAPLAHAWELARAWPAAELVVVPGAGHDPGGALEAELVRATDRFAAAA